MLTDHHRRCGRRFQFASKSHFSDNEDEANVSDRSCKYPPCKISGTPDFVSSVTGSHDTRRLTNNIFRRQRPFSYGIDRPKVICGEGVTRFSRRIQWPAARATPQHAADIKHDTHKDRDRQTAAVPSLQTAFWGRGDDKKLSALSSRLV